MNRSKVLDLMAALPVDEEGHGVGGDLDEGAEEEGPGDVAAQVGGVLHVSVVAHESHHTEGQRNGYLLIDLLVRPFLIVID